MRVMIPSPLHSYTGATIVEATGDSLGAVLADLDRQFPGIRFRMVDERDMLRPHVRFFVNGVAVFELGTPLKPADQVFIVQALSGG